jgi:hypothetical protein
MVHILRLSAGVALALAACGLLRAAWGEEATESASAPVIKSDTASEGDAKKECDAKCEMKDLDATTEEKACEECTPEMATGEEEVTPAPEEPSPSREIELENEAPDQSRGGDIDNSRLSAADGSDYYR